MDQTLRFVLKILALIAFILSALWAYFNFGYEPVIAIVVSLGALIGLFVTESKNKGKITQVQKSGSHSKNYQASGDIHINQGKND